jgi:hypothetical protein
MEWSRLREGVTQQFYWMFCLALAVNPLLGFRTELSNFSVLVMPVFLIFTATERRWFRTNKLLFGFLTVLITILPWIFNSDTFSGNKPISPEFLINAYPIIVIIGLYWVRWWSIRPPRTIMDKLTQTTR